MYRQSNKFRVYSYTIDSSIGTLVYYLTRILRVYKHKLGVSNENKLWTLINISSILILYVNIRNEDIKKVDKKSKYYRV